jgi:hypothetical protein
MLDGRATSSYSYGSFAESSADAEEPQEVDAEFGAPSPKLERMNSVVQFPKQLVPRDNRVVIAFNA